jgi:hypothetical protein
MQGVVSNTIFQLLWNGAPTVMTTLTAYLALLQGLPGWLIALIACAAFFLVTLGINFIHVLLLRRRQHTAAARALTTGQDVAEPKKVQALKPIITRAEVRRSIYTHMGAMFHKLLEERRIHFYMTVFNGLPERISFVEEASGFILLDGKPLHKRPLFTVSPRKYPEDRQTGISLIQEFSEEAANEINDRLNRGEKLSFDFDEVHIYFKVEGKRYRLELPEGLSCQTSITCAETQSVSATGKISVRYLNTLFDEGEWLLRQAVEGAPDLTASVKEWEKRAGNYLAAFIGKDEKARFLDDEDMEVYAPPAGYSPKSKQHFLDRIHTRVMRLERLIERMN